MPYKSIVGDGTEGARQIIEILQNIQELLAMSIQPEPPPGAEVYGQRNIDWSMIIAMAACAALPASPVNSRRVVISPAETLLAENQSEPLLSVEITNEDVAQWIWVSTRGVLATAGRIILPLETVRYVIPQGHELYGLCAVATVNVSVSEGVNILANLISGGG